jgi:PPOX class probable F420-dependent enzyme
MNEALESVRSAKTVLLRTCKRDCTPPVSTPVSITFDGDRAFFRSYDRASKTRRLRKNPTVEVAAGTLSGRVTGPTIVTRARLLATARPISRQRRLRASTASCRASSSQFTHRPMGYRTLQYELTARDGRAE